MSVWVDSLKTRLGRIRLGLSWSWQQANRRVPWGVDVHNHWPVMVGVLKNRGADSVETGEQELGASWRLGGLSGRERLGHRFSSRLRWSR